MEDILWDSLTDSYTGFPMAITAENLAEQYKISKEECDKYALQTQQRWKTGELEFMPKIHYLRKEQTLQALNFTNLYKLLVYCMIVY